MEVEETYLIRDATKFKILHFDKLENQLHFIMGLLESYRLKIEEMEGGMEEGYDRVWVLRMLEEMGEEETKIKHG